MQSEEGEEAGEGCSCAAFSPAAGENKPKKIFFRLGQRKRIYHYIYVPEHMYSSITHPPIWFLYLSYGKVSCYYYSGW